MFQKANNWLMHLKWYPYLSAGLLTLLGILIFYQYVLLFEKTEGWSGTTDLVLGLSEKPYVFRVLIPFLIGILLRIVPQETEIYAILIMALFLLGFILALRYLFTSLWERSILLDIICGVALVGLIPLGNNNKVYDLPGLFFVTFGLAFLARRQFIAYLLTFFLATLNKETSILLILVFALDNAKKIPLTRFWILLSIQVLYYLMTRLGLMLVFRNNPGGFAQFHAHDFLLAWQFIPLYSILATLMGVLILIMLFHRFREKPAFLRTAILATVPLMVFLYFVTGFPFEFRFFYEIYPLLLLSLAFLLSRVGRLPLKPAFE